MKTKTVRCVYPICVLNSRIKCLSKQNISTTYTSLLLFIVTLNICFSAIEAFGFSVWAELLHQPIQKSPPRPVDNVTKVVSTSFSYSNPNRDWPVNFPTCGGKKQSPINIGENGIKLRPIENSIIMSHYNSLPKSMTLSNNGHSVMLQGTWRKKPSISGGPLKGTYLFEQLHFHWGDSNEYGSEHTVLNNSFVLEMHLVHYNRNYGNCSRASEFSDGYVVLTYFFAVDKNLNLGLELLKSNFHAIVNPKASIAIKAFPLTLFDLDFNEKGYFHYFGSLTTPPCSENVNWIIPASARSVSKNMMQAFRSIALESGDVSNNRPIQPINKRPVYFIY